MRAPELRDRALRRSAVALLVVALLACEPTASPDASDRSTPGTPTVTPSAQTTLAAAPDLSSIELHQLDRRYVPNVLVSADRQALWSAGEVWPSELWRYVPGAAQPERLFASPRSDGNITGVVAAGSGYTFVELSESAFGKGGWRIWFLAGAGEEPRELDRGLAPGAGVAPTIAIDDERIVWAAFDEPDSGPVSRIRMVSTAAPETVTTLAELPIRDGLLWYPALDGKELWYAVIRGDFDLTGVGDEFHIETLDLGNPDAEAARFPGIANDFNPAMNDAFVVWKTVKPGDSALNWGTLHVMDRRTEAVARIPIDDANRPSIGDRFVAFDEITHSRLAVYDPVTGVIHDLAPVLTEPGYGGQSISGRLLVFFTQSGGDPPQIGWATLPE